ncbi:MAG TPA: DUF4160 domain-containing protein [Thermoanaerobaculia bacterium]|nr:DUF4160 domain-containing protein [Thermoanaerobaculia bacterium]
MPEISRFFGIVIRMYVEAGGPHHRPHFHAYRQNESAVYAVDVVECIGGRLPGRDERLVLAWAEIHRDELIENWLLLQQGRPAKSIEPLR